MKYEKELKQYIKAGKYGNEIVDLLNLEVKINISSYKEEIKDQLVLFFRDYGRAYKLGYLFNESTKNKEFFKEENYVEKLDFFVELFLKEIKTKSAVKLYEDYALEKLDPFLNEKMNSEKLDLFRSESKSICSDYSDFFKLEVIKETSKFYILERVCRVDFVEKDFTIQKNGNEAAYKYSFKIEKNEDYDFNIGDFIYFRNYNESYSGDQYFISEEEFNKYKEILTDILKMKDFKETEEVKQFFKTIISSKFVKNFEANQDRLIKKIDLLKKEFLDFKLPTTEELLQSYEEKQLSWSSNINSKTDNAILELEKRAEIFNQMNDLRGILKNSKDLKKRAFEESNRKSVLTKYQKEMASLITKYYYVDKTLDIFYGSRNDKFIEIQKAVELDLSDLKV